MEVNFDAFNDYVMQFDMDEERIKYKFNHSYRVNHQSEMIAHDENLSEEDMRLASFIGLLHDIGRFEQWTQYQTFSDGQSFDHGDFGAKLLFDEKLIENFDLDKSEYNVVRAAIENHNKIYINKNVVDERELLHCKIIRDADKLDILYALSTNKLIVMNEDDSDISEKISEDFYNKLQVKKTDINSKNDCIILYFGLVFDLNFPYSFRRVLDEGYLDKMYEHLEHKDIFKPYYEYVVEFLKKEVSKYDREEV